MCFVVALRLSGKNVATQLHYTSAYSVQSHCQVKQKIRNLRSVTGMRGTYTLLPAGLLAAAQALRLNDGDIGLLMGIGVSKIVKQ